MRVLVGFLKVWFCGPQIQIVNVHKETFQGVKCLFKVSRQINVSNPNQLINTVVHCRKNRI